MLQDIEKISSGVLENEQEKMPTTYFGRDGPYMMAKGDYNLIAN